MLRQYEKIVAGFVAWKLASRTAPTRLAVTAFLQPSDPRHLAFATGTMHMRSSGMRAESSSSASSSPSDVETADTDISSSSEPHPPDEAPEPDLFEYFDPLLSPHAYPNGIVPPSSSSKSRALEEYEPPSAAAQSAAKKGMSNVPSESLARARGGGADNVDTQRPNREASLGNSDALLLKDPLRMDRLDVLGVPHPDPKQYRKEDYDSVKLDNLNFLGVGTGQSSWPRDQLGLPVVNTYESVFDPTVSPHKYPHGTPSEVLTTRRNEEEEDDAYWPTEDATSAASSPPIVGILLIDHGSKRDSSNQRLHDMASWYQECVPSVAVEPAHMEIASPSIKEGMAKLLERGAQEIVCHPFFLGSGRHVSEDIPRLIEEAMDELGVEIPVRTTPHVGSDMSMMLEAVHALVKQSSALLTQSGAGRS